MSKLIKTDMDYAQWIQNLKARYKLSQIKAATQVNSEMLRFYWTLGRDIVARDAENRYGSGFYENLCRDLKEALPEASGFSRQNLQYMKRMYLLYSEDIENRPQLAGISEGRNCQQLAGTSAGENCQQLAGTSAGENCQQLAGISEIHQQNAKNQIDENCQQLVGTSAGENCQQLAGTSAGENCPQLVGISETYQQNTKNQINENCPQLAGTSADEICPQLADISEDRNCQQPIDDAIFSIPWGHHRIIIDRYFAKRETKAALFYVRKAMEEGWSRNVLKSFIDTNLHMRQGKALTSFARWLPSPESELAQELTRDPYIFDFTEMTGPYKERELKKALMANISRFLLELGAGFAYIGEEYRLNIGNTEQFIDLLFYNMRLHAYCVIEVKTGSFSPGDIGQLGTYMTAVNHILKKEQDNSTIGLLICKDKDNVLAQYALESSSQPIGVAEFQLTKFVPDEFKSVLPSIDEIELELK